VLFRWLPLFLDFPADAFDAGVAFWREVTGGASRLDQLCLDIPPGAFERECSFWAALTGWDLRSGGRPDLAAP
jgi:hypothetical protein